MTAKEFITGLPSQVSADVLKDLSTVFHFDIDGDGGGKYTVKVGDGKMDVAEGLEGEAKCVVTSNATNLMDVVEGRTNAMMALLMGKIKISNQGEMIKYAKIFGLLK